MDSSLEREDEIIINAGTHTDMIKMSFADFKKLANPKIQAFGMEL